MKLLLLLLLTLRCFGQIKVFLHVEFNGKNALPQQAIESIISRELRKLGDVQIVAEEKDSSRALFVLGYPIENEAHTINVGYAFSAVATAWLPGLGGILLNHWLFTGGASAGVDFSGEG
jgi:hypothetical protein